jgi:hypothetical protein
MLNESPYGVPDADQERIMPAKIAMARKNQIALVVHDKRKEELCEWARFNCQVLAEHSLYATAITGHLLTRRLGLNVTCLKPIVATASRLGCESASPDRCGVEHSGCMESGFGRLHSVIAHDVGRI